MWAGRFPRITRYAYHCSGRDDIALADQDGAQVPIQTFDAAVFQHHMVAVAVVAMGHFFHHSGQHGIDVGVMTVQVDAVMEACAVKDGVGAVAVVGVDFEEVERQTQQSILCRLPK